MCVSLGIRLAINNNIYILIGVATVTTEKSITLKRKQDSEHTGMNHWVEERT